MKINKLEIIYKYGENKVGGYQAIFTDEEISDENLKNLETAFMDKLSNFSTCTEYDIRKIIREELSWLWVLTPKNETGEIYQRNKSIKQAAKRIAELTQWGPVE